MDRAAREYPDVPRGGPEQARPEGEESLGQKWV